MSVERARKMGRATRKHGASFSRLYSIWSGLKSRCLNPNSPQFKNYGGRGIKVCHRWRNGGDGKSGFECFLADMGERPSAKHSLDRIDTNGDYEPGNCRWATAREQNNNTRANRIVEFDGERMSISMAIERSGISTPHGTVYTRLARGWPLERAIT